MINSHDENETRVAGMSSDRSSQRACPTFIGHLYGQRLWVLSVSGLRAQEKRFDCSPRPER